MRETRKQWAISKHQKGLSTAIHNSHASRGKYEEHHAQSRLAVQVEYPRQGEVVAQPSYTLRISVALGQADTVEVSIDHGPWLPCREALGVWWYDWSGYDQGEHELTARTHTAGGIYAVSAPCRFRVE